MENDINIQRRKYSPINQTSVKLDYLITFIVSWIACLINNWRFLLIIKEFKSQSTTLATFCNLGEREHEFREATWVFLLPVGCCENFGFYWDEIENYWRILDRTVTYLKDQLNYKVQMPQKDKEV